MQWDVIVIGAGAAGLMAGTRAAERGRRTLLLEKNRHTGIKILMSGGTRCNLTHATDARGIVTGFGSSGRFLHSALAALSPQALVDLVEAEGVATKVEPTGKIFPCSNRASDVLAALMKRLARSGCELALEEPVRSIERSDSGFVVSTDHQLLRAPRLIITTGGRSYPGSGTTGDGYAWAQALGHTLVPPRPALTPITTSALWVRELQGVTIPDVDVRVIDPELPKKKRVLARRRESLLFAHFGLSGPAALDVSREISGHAEPHRLKIELDLLPDLPLDELDQRIQSWMQQGGGKQVANSLLPLELPQRLLIAVLKLAEIDPTARAAELPKTARRRLVETIKRLEIPVSGTLGYKKAEVTAGGVSLAEVNSQTMESKLVPGLFFAGEILDLDGRIGGFNFQAAFSTGWLAGEHV